MEVIYWLILNLISNATRFAIIYMYTNADLAFSIFRAYYCRKICFSFCFHATFCVDRLFQYMPRYFVLKNKSL